MAVYRQIQTTFWQDSFVLSLTPEEKYFYIYLMTNSKTKQCGIYELPLQIAQIETGYNRETVIKLIQKFIENGKIIYDWETNEILLTNWMRFNPIRNPLIKKCVDKELLEVKNPVFIEFFNTHTNGYCNKNNNNKKNKNNNKNKEEQKPEPLVIQTSHDTPEFKVAFSNFIQHRKELKKPLTPMAEKGALKKLYEVDVGTAVKMIEQTIANGWQGIFELKGNNGNTQYTTRKSDATTRATFKHTPEQIKELESFGESLRERYPNGS